jgi:hypothetical protein
MAWNPSPEVQVARDAAAALGRLVGSVNRCVILYTTDGEKCGYVSYGRTKALCAEAKSIANIAHAAVFSEEPDQTGMTKDEQGYTG